MNGQRLTVQTSDFIALVKEFFPEVTSDEDALNVLWNYTGFPTFFQGHPLTSCREQLAHLHEVGPEVVDAEFEALSHLIGDDDDRSPQPAVA